MILHYKNINNLTESLLFNLKGKRYSSLVELIKNNVKVQNFVSKVIVNINYYYLIFLCIFQLRNQCFSLFYMY